MNRTGACLLSLFMPILIGLPFAMILPMIHGIPRNVLAFVLIATAALIIALRVHFASWYVRDKGRNDSWGLVGALGLIGWLVLWSLEDRGFRFSR